MKQQSTTVRRLLITALGVGIIAGVSFERWQTQSDPTGPFPFNPSQPYTLVLGRGNGVDGFNTVAIYPDGRVVINQKATQTSWERATVRLSPEEVRLVAESVVRNQLPSLKAEYHRDDVFDGKQWEMIIRQSGRVKETYFNNNFPAAIVNFSRELDTIIQNASRNKLDWLPSSRIHAPLWTIFD
ncbi:MAG: hypothetical protein RL088_4226 [Verrucomicrobiota bacterium]|jgi:hypothetical protein